MRGVRKAMTSSPPSSSDGGSGGSSAAFELLAEPVRRWVWQQEWTELRDAQEAAIPHVLGGKRDVIIAAATAAGKTEAAFLPICSALCAGAVGGIHAMYVGPLKALINDQFQRLDGLCDDLKIPVHRWHGDVSAAEKRQVLREPSGILLITPESLEAQFVLRGPLLRALFAPLRWIVVDELHAFIGTERGRQLQSLLHRVELLRGDRIPRVALSATLGDLMIAADFLRPGEGDHVVQIVGRDGDRELRVQVRGYRADSADEDHEQTAIARHLFRVLRGTDNLVFANARSEVERLADVLRRLSEHEQVPNEFLPHHGSLSKALREEVEAALKDRTRPLTAVCTNTLELGIDIGSVASVAQIGPPASVAATRQRLGRSGRRGEPAVFRSYVRESALDASDAPEDTLRAHLVQSIAVIQLLIAGWCEPPRPGALHLSTLVQQILSLIAQCGGVRADEAFRVLCGTGPFRLVTTSQFGLLLRELGARDIVAQTHDGTLVVGLTGERIVGRYDFYAAFSTPEEYRLVAGAHVLGTLPMLHPIAEGDLLIFAGRRWRVVSVDADASTLFVVPAPGGRVPLFFGDGPTVHDGVRSAMRSTYVATEMPRFLDDVARQLLQEARANFARLGLLETDAVSEGSDVILFPWRGDVTQHTLTLALRQSGFTARLSGCAIRIVGTSIDDVREWRRGAVASPPPDPLVLTSASRTVAREKYDGLLPEGLLAQGYAAAHIDVGAAWDTLGTLRLTGVEG